VLGEKADCLIAGLDRLHHVPHGGVLPDEVGLAQLGSLVVSLTFGCFNDVSEVVVLQGIFRLVVGGRFVLLLIVIFVGTILVGVDSTGNWISVHIVIKLIIHLFLNGRLTALSFDGSELGRVNDAGGRLSCDLVGQDGQRVFGQLLVGVEAVKTLVVGAILALCLLGVAY